MIRVEYLGLRVVDSSFPNRVNTEVASISGRLINWIVPYSTGLFEVSLV